MGTPNLRLLAEYGIASPVCHAVYVVIWKGLWLLVVEFLTGGYVWTWWDWATPKSALYHCSCIIIITGFSRILPGHFAGMGGWCCFMLWCMYCSIIVHCRVRRRFLLHLLCYLQHGEECSLPVELVPADTLGSRIVLLRGLAMPGELWLYSTVRVFTFIVHTLPFFLDICSVGYFMYPCLCSALVGPSHPCFLTSFISVFMPAYMHRKVADKSRYRIQARRG